MTWSAGYRSVSPAVAARPRRCLDCDRPVLIATDDAGEILALGDGHERTAAKTRTWYRLAGAVAVNVGAGVHRRLLHPEHHCPPRHGR